MATDQEIRDAGFKYIPQQKYLQNPFELPTAPEAPVVNQGIVNTNAFANSGGGNDFNPQGNIFGEGTAVSPVFGNSYIDTVRREGPDSFAAYNKLSQAGGTAPAGMFQTDSTTKVFTKSFSNTCCTSATTYKRRRRNTLYKCWK